MFLDEEFKDFLQLLDNIFIMNDYTINSFKKLKYGYAKSNKQVFYDINLFLTAIQNV